MNTSLLLRVIMGCESCKIKYKLPHYSHLLIMHNYIIMWLGRFNRVILAIVWCRMSSVRPRSV